jgi:hypothetical protein
MMELTTNKYLTCDECHKHKGVFISLGGVDPAGFVDQESGAVVCADCLRKALAMLDVLIMAMKLASPDDVVKEAQPTATDDRR